jgi:hypothetical protein
MSYPSLRSILCGVLLIVVVAIWQQQSTQMAGSADLMVISPPVPAVLFLLLLVGCLNPLLKRLDPRLPFNSSELITVFTMTIVGLPLVTTGWAQAILPSRIAFRYYATPENGYQRDFFSFVKSWVGPADPEVVRGFYEGGAAAVPWLAWMPSLLVWGAFTLVFYFTFVCLAVLVKDHWMERERLSFPLLKLPLELIASAERRDSILKNRLLWLGCLIPLVLHTLNGLNAYIPGMPTIDIRFDISGKLHNYPWSNMSGVGIFFRPLLVGVGYLMNLDVSFSLWFFFLVQKLMLVVSAAMAWGGTESSMSGFPFANQQRSGAVIMLGLVYIWMLRKHLGSSFAASFFRAGRDNETVKEQGQASQRLAWLGLIGGSLAVVGFSVALGMSLVVGSCFFLLIFLHIFVLTKVRAEGGVPCIYVYEPPGDILKMPLGSHALGTSNLTGMALLGWIMQDARAAMMPNMLDGYKLNRDDRKPFKGMMLVFLVAILAGMICGVWTQFELCYEYGMNSLGRWRSNESHRWFQELSGLIQNPSQAKSMMPMAFVGVGALITALLSFLRMRFLWWPFHPIGYAFGSILWVEWSCIFFGWLARLVIHRLTGGRGYRRFLPFFLGLIMGDFIMYGFWGIMGCVIKGKGYLPGW